MRILTISELVQWPSYRGQTLEVFYNESLLLLFSDKVGERILFVERLRKHARQTDDDSTVEQASLSLETEKHEPDIASLACDSDEDGMEQNTGEKTDSDEPIELNAMPCDTADTMHEGDVGTVEIERFSKAEQPAAVKPIAGKKRKHFLAKLKVNSECTFGM